VFAGGRRVVLNITVTIAIARALVRSPLKRLMIGARAMQHLCTSGTPLPRVLLCIRLANPRHSCNGVSPGLVADLLSTETFKGVER
jgi:hypothetical protein